MISWIFTAILIGTYLLYIGGQMLLSNKTNRFYFTLIVTEDVKIWQEHQWYSAAHHVLLFFLITTWGHLNNNSNNNNGLLAYSLEGFITN